MSKSKAHIRVCRTCKTEKLLTDFTKNSSKMLGHDYQCLDCHKLEEKERRDKNPEHSRELNRKSADRNRHKWIKMWADYQRRYCQKYPDRHRANAVLNYHVEHGNIMPPHVCQRCANKGKVEAHHADYAKPLEVIWLCRICHKSVHIGRNGDVESKSASAL